MIEIPNYAECRLASDPKQNRVWEFEQENEHVLLNNPANEEQRVMGKLEFEARVQEGSIEIIMYQNESQEANDD